MLATSSTGPQSTRQTPKRGRYISKACNQCRRRRTKCDGKQPACAQCTKRSLPCCYTANEDGRNPAPKTYVQLLRKRIEMLENAVRIHHIDVDSTFAQNLPVNNNRHAQTDLALQHGAWDGMGTATRGALSIDEAVNFDQDGESRFFGATSGRLDFDTFHTPLSASSPGLQPILDSPSRDALPSEPAKSSSLRSRVNRFVSEIENESVIFPALEEHLLELYFRWEETWTQVVDEQLFRQSRQTGGRFFSHLLLNCILCLGSRYSDDVKVRSNPANPNTAGTLFLDKAEVLLHYELKWPSVTTIQALILMSNAYVGSGADAAGWLHLGMANRLAIDMGLNVAPSSLAHGSCTSIQELELKRRLYLTLYVLDKHLASYTGRICTLLISQGSLEFPQREHPTFSCFGTGLGTTHTLGTSGLDEMQRALVSHSKIVEKILCTLYNPNRTEREWQPLQFVEKCLLELRNWFYDLPADLRIHRLNERPPQVYTLHMIYQTSYILLMKPFICILRKNHIVLDNVLDETGMNCKALSVCKEAAASIITVAKRYRKQFGSFRRSPVSVTHCILSAALISLQVPELVPQSTAADSYAAIEFCLSALHELSESWNPAKRYKETLTRIWEAKKPRIAQGRPAPSGLPIPQPAAPNTPPEITPEVSDDGIQNQDSVAISDDAMQSQLDFTPWDVMHPSSMHLDMAPEPQWVAVDICPLFGSMPEDYDDQGTWNMERLINGQHL